MPNTDFFDDDLVRQREATKRVKMGPGDEPVETLVDAGGDSNVRSISDFNLTRMAKYRHEVDGKSAVAVQELERLRKRQEQLESEKRELEVLRTKQEEYVHGKREMIDHLKRSLVTLERQEVEAERLKELLGTSRKRFKELLADVESISEDTWPDDQFRDELNKSLGIIEEARMEYNKAMSKIEAVRGEEKTSTGAPRSAVLFEEHPTHAHVEKSFGEWIKIGFAVSLPLVVTVVLVSILFLIARSNGLL